MKILIIYPPCLEERLQSEDVSVVPIGAYYVAAVLKEKKHDVEILNFHNIREKPERIREILTRKKPDVVGFSILHANRWGGIETARIAKEINPDVKIIFGGIGASFLWEHFLTHFKEIDFVVVGEGEYAFSELITRIQKKDYGKLDAIKGIAFRKGEEIVKTGERDFIRNIDKLPIPAKHFLYQHVTLSRGCPGDCVFCGSPRFWKRKVRFHSADYFVRQLELLNKKGVSFFYFSDDTFTLKKNLVIEVCKKILKKKLKISWAAISRVDYVDEDIISWMRRAGCIQISFGVESGSEKMRKTLNKSFEKAQIQKAFSLTQKYGILPRAYFIYGCPGETRETVRETCDLIREIKPLSIIFYILDIFPGTSLYEEFKKRTGLTDDIWLKRIEDIMYFETVPELSQEQVLGFGKSLRNEYHKHLPDFADQIEVTDDKAFFPSHADFFSRLGMTFSHGDYARIEAIKDKSGIAEKLYQKALTYHPDRRAYLGLGVLNQKKGDYQEAIRIVSEGLKHFPSGEQLNICLGISYINIGNYSEALARLLRFPYSKEAAYYIAHCYKALDK